MNWISLLCAGMFEIAFTFGLKLTHTSFKPLPVVITAVSALLSFGLLWLSLKTIPLGTAYAIWTGMGVAGAALIGVFYFNEPASASKFACIALIIAGGVGLRVLGVAK